MNDSIPTDEFTGEERARLRGLLRTQPFHPRFWPRAFAMWGYVFAAVMVIYGAIFIIVALVYGVAAVTGLDK